MKKLSSIPETPQPSITQVFTTCFNMTIFGHFDIQDQNMDPQELARKNDKAAKSNFQEELGLLEDKINLATMNNKSSNCEFLKYYNI